MSYTIHTHHGPAFASSYALAVAILAICGGYIERIAS